MAIRPGESYNMFVSREWNEANDRYNANQQAESEALRAEAAARVRAANQGNTNSGPNLNFGTNGVTPLTGRISVGGSNGSPSGGGTSMNGGGGGVNVGNTTLDQLTNIADPWSSQRGQYQTQLSSLMKDPSSFLQSDLFKASTAAGLEGVNRSAAAGGMLKSGNRLQALMDYGTKNAPDNFFRMADLLGGYAGAKNQNPGGGLNAASQFMNNATSQYNADTSRYSAENNARIGQFNADTARQGNAQQAQLAQTQNDTAQQRWQQQQQQQQDQWQYQQQQQQNADLQRQMQEQLNLAMNYR